MQLKALVMTAILALASTAFAMEASDVPQGAHLVTSGMAKIDAIPDMATLTIEVHVVDKDPAVAKQQVDQRVAKYFDFLQSHGIDKKEINAANLRTTPEYEYLKNDETNLKGYQAMRVVQVKLMQLDKLNELLDGALKVELKEIRAIELGVSKPEAYQKQVRQKAIENAVAQAKSLAQGFGTKLGPVYSIRYRVGNTRPVMARSYIAADMAVPKHSAAETYHQQSVTFDDQVDVVFELQR